MKRILYAAFVLFAGLAPALSASPPHPSIRPGGMAPEPPARPITAGPVIWLAPNSSNATQLFERPWPDETGKAIGGVKLYIDWLRKATEAELRRMADLVRARRLRVAVEVGGLLNHDWQDRMGEQSAEAELPPLRRWRDAGGGLDVLELDGPIRRAKGFDAAGEDPAKRFTDYQAIARELDEYLALVAKEFPDTRFHLLVNFPNWGWRGAPDYHARGPDQMNWGDYHAALTGVLAVTQGAVPKFSALTIDQPHGYATGQRPSANPAARTTDWLARMADLCAVARTNGLACALIVNDEAGGQTADESFAAGTLAYARLVKERGLCFDHVLIQSWYPFPTNVVGDTLPAQMAVAAEVARLIARPGSTGSTGRLSVRPDSDGAYLIRADTGQRVVLNGFNYIRLRDGGHATFKAPTRDTSSRYDPAAADQMLETITAAGYNAVRVFVIGRKPTNQGIGAGAPGELYGPYLDNLADFIGRAARRGVWTIPTLGDGELPYSWQAEFTNKNRIYLTREGLEAKKHYIRLLLEGLQARGVDVAATCAFLELQNELYLRMDEWPFDLTQGVVRGPDGRDYDLARDEDRRKLAVNGLRTYHRECVAAAKAVLPELLVGEGIFTLDAAGWDRAQAASWRPKPARGVDQRLPPLASELLNNGLDVLDLHLYERKPMETTAAFVKHDLDSTGFFLPEARAALARVPVLLGEYGVLESTDTNFAAALQRAAAIRSESIAHGFTAGALYWTYDTHEQPKLWHATTDWNAFTNALPPLAQTPDRGAGSAIEVLER